MYKLCHHVKDNRKLCNSPAMRHQQYCYHHLEEIRRQRRIAQAKQRFLRAIVADHPLNSLLAIQQTMERINDGVPLDKLEPKLARVMLSALRLMANNIRDCPEELADWIAYSQRGAQPETRRL